MSVLRSFRVQSMTIERLFSWKGNNRGNFRYKQVYAEFSAFSTSPCFGAPRYFRLYYNYKLWPQSISMSQTLFRNPNSFLHTSGKQRQKSGLSTAELKKAIDKLTDQFMEARELIEDARESIDTVYFSEDMTDAQEAVNSTLDQYKNLLDQLSEEQRQEVLRTIGLKMEELKAQEEAIKEMLHDSH